MSILGSIVFFLYMAGSAPVFARPNMAAEVAPFTSELVHRMAAKCIPPSIIKATDGTAATIVFDDMVAESGRRAKTGADASKTCHFDVTVPVPAGTQVGVREVSIRGYTNMTKDATSELKATFNFDGKAPTGSVEYKTTGPTKQAGDNYLAIGKPTDVWAPCGKTSVTFSADISIQVANTTAASDVVIFADSFDVSLISKKC